MSLNKPFICPGILDSTKHNLVLLVGNLYKHTLFLKKGQQLAIGRITSLKEIHSIHTKGDSTKLGLNKHTENENKELDKLLIKFKDIFSTSKQEFGLLINTFHNIDMGTNKPLKSRPNQKSHTEEQIITTESKNY